MHPRKKKKKLFFWQLVKMSNFQNARCTISDVQPSNLIYRIWNMFVYKDHLIYFVIVNRCVYIKNFFPENKIQRKHKGEN